MSYPDDIEDWRRGVRFGFLLGVLASGGVALLLFLVRHFVR